MIRYSIKFISLICLLGVGYFFVGCSDLKNQQQDEYVIKVGNRTMTVADFNKAFEIAKNAYPHNRILQPDLNQEIRLRLVQQMIEEMILLERAKELNIAITDSQVKAALKEIKKDYPDNVFQEILLEYAVPYRSWKEGLKTRLLMEKVIRQELDDTIEITDEDISKYYEEHFKDDSASPDGKAVPEDINNTIVKILHKEKMEKAYSSWIKELKSRYTVEVNQSALEKMTGF